MSFPTSSAPARPAPVRIAPGRPARHGTPPSHAPLRTEPGFAGDRSSRIPRFDLDRRPFLVLLELTRACALACRHCRADACPDRDPDELTTAEVRGMLDDLARLGPPRPIVVLTGGDPFSRPDLADLVAHGSGQRLAVAVAPSGTPLATPERLAALRVAGAATVSFSIDGATPASHDDFRGVPGSFGWTVAAARAAREAGLRLQLNTTVTATTVHELPALARLARELDASLWSLFFLVATGRGRHLAALGPDENDDLLHALADLAPLVPLKTTEAPQYRRVLAQRAAGSAGGGTGRSRAGERGPLYGELVDGFVRELKLDHWPPAPATLGPPAGRPPLAVGDGRGVVFVSHVGEVQPSGFLPFVVGNVRSHPLTEIYRQAPLLRRLRDPGALGGRCGRCQFRAVCGGSRARAYARAGDPLAEDPGCPYEPDRPGPVAAGS